MKRKIELKFIDNPDHFENGRFPKRLTLTKDIFPFFIKIEHFSHWGLSNLNRNVPLRDDEIDFLKNLVDKYNHNIEFDNKFEVLIEEK